MSDVQIGLSGLGLLLVFIALRIPIGISLIGVSFGGLWVLMGWKVAWGSLGLLPFQFAANWVLSSVPMFLLLGFVCYHGQLTQGLFRAARVWLERVPGGLAVAAVMGSAGFAAVSGSSIACSATMGRIAIPEMLKARYHPELATGSVAVAGTIGALIPPSIILILYGVVAQVPVTGLFLGGIAAGLITALGYVLVIMIRVKLNPALAPDVAIRTPASERIAALKDTWPVILLMIGIFGGLFSGVFTATEAGAVGALMAVVIALAKGTLTRARFSAAIVDTVLTTSTLIIIGIGATLLTRFLALSGSADYLSEQVLALGADPVLIMAGVVIVYLLLGLFL
ncbi:MAG: C4-dicarboxylate ABC transporter, partial [Tistrella sp.]|nr:C4-dicarboxylate ABC transporter [Tistrella sp.]